MITARNLFASHSTHLALGITCAAALIAGLFIAGGAEAGERAARPNRERPHAAQPRWESKQVERHRTADGHERNTTWTGANGKTATREADVSIDKEAGTRTREVTTTGPNGKTRTVNDVTTRTDDGYTRETVVTHPNGSTVTRSVSGSHDAENQSRNREISVDRNPPPAE